MFKFVASVYHFVSIAKMHGYLSGVPLLFVQIAYTQMLELCASIYYLYQLLGFFWD